MRSLAEIRKANEDFEKRERDGDFDEERAEKCAQRTDADDRQRAREHQEDEDKLPNPIRIKGAVPEGIYTNEKGDQLKVTWTKITPEDYAQALIEAVKK